MEESQSQVQSSYLYNEQNNNAIKCFPEVKPT